MEVMVRNLPEQMTEKQVDNFFRPILATFDIKAYSCQRLGRGGAKLTIADRIKGARFLQVHGQLQAGAKGFALVIKKLFVHGRPVNCSLSKNEVDDYLVRALQKEESMRYAALQRKPNIVLGKAQLRPVEPRAFDISAVRCGQWGYTGGQLAFSTYMADQRIGRIIFGSRCASIKLLPGRPNLPTQQIELPYNSIESFVVGSNRHSLTFSLWEGPRIYEMVSSSLEEGLQKMSFGTPAPKQSFKRKRLSSMNEAHSKIVGSCLAYQFVLSQRSDIDAVLALKKHAEVPLISDWNTQSVTRVPFHNQMSDLNNMLAGDVFMKVPFEVKFQLQRLAQEGFLSPSRVAELLPIVSDRLNRQYPLVVAAALRAVASALPYAGPDAEAADFKIRNISRSLDKSIEAVVNGEVYSSAMNEQHDHMMLVHKVFVTPTRIMLSGPEPETKNRVLRKYSAYPNHFLSVAFQDENGEQLRFDRQTDSSGIYQERFKGILEGVINIAGCGYEFLGFSHSSLRSSACWFMAPFTLNGDLIHARSVIKDLGDFSLIRSPAKCAARIGQAFSQTLSSVSVPRSAITRIPDVERNEYTFSDGVGTCSKSVVRKIWQGYSIGRAFKPTVFQIRFQGAKGVISLDSRLHGDQLNLRKSMIKFEVHETSASNIEICGAANKPLPMYLNRPLIKILEDLGVPDQPLMDLQARAVEKLRETTLSPVNASSFFERNYIGKASKLSWLVRNMSHIGIDFSDDEFLRHTLELAVLIQLREIKHRSRILVEKGTTVYGIMDETGVLREDEVYCSIHTDRGPLLLTGSVVITRSPAMHPGDVQCVTAIDVPEDSPLRELHNMVVFSQHGQRDLPSQLSGGDLDGDLYNVIHDRGLYPRHLVDPASYKAAKPIDIGRTVERSDMTDFFIKFMENDNLGMISTLHQILADQKPHGTLDPACMSLAAQASTAVDYSKTGIAVSIQELPKYPKGRPDFQAPGPHVLIEKDIVFEEEDDLPSPPEDDDELDEVASFNPPRHSYYESQKVLGKLYRAIDEHSFLARLQSQARPQQIKDKSVIERVWQYVRNKTALIQWQYHLPLAGNIKENYEENLLETMREYSTHPSRLATEVEVFCGSLLGKNGAQSKRQREFSTTMKEKFDRDVTYIVQWIIKGESGEGDGEALARSIACLDVARREKTFVKKVGGPLVSFQWIAASVCLQEVDKLGAGIVRFFMRSQ